MMTGLMQRKQREISRYTEQKTVPLMMHRYRWDEEHDSADEKAEAERNETDSVDDVSNEHPFVHHPKILFRVTTQLSVVA